MSNLLVVDDDASTRTFLSLAMQREGHQVTEAETGEDCLALAQHWIPDMILLDAQMPGTDGFTCCAELKALLREKCPPVIIITGLADQASVDRAFAVGAIDYVTKPIHIGVLRHRVHQVLRERELMQQLAIINQQLAAANQELQQLARIDALTQLANRRYLDEILVKEWGRLGRQQKSLGVLLCDVDFFKDYNDLYGHLAGDRCLQEVSQALQLSVQRSADLVARYGGEEFIILLPETDAIGTQQVARHVHQQISDLAIPHLSSVASDVITLSIGAACTVPEPAHHPSELLEAADRALYAAKAGGRNQTVMQQLQFSLV